MTHIQQKQLFDEPRPETQSSPATDLAPVVWVQEVRVLRSLSLDKEQLVRRIELHRGLNILWAKPPTPRANEDEEQSELHTTNVSGHSAGKTTFTRFLRHLLGEPTFGDEPLTKEVRDEFPDGWITALVHVDGHAWLVARPFSPAGMSFVVRSEDWKDLVCDSGREDYEVFLDAVESATFGPLSHRMFPSSGGTAGWQHLLPWLTRDQDCHFNSLSKWRCADSQSRCEKLDAADRQYLVQTFLDLLTKKELDLQRANVHRRAKIKRLKVKLGQLEHQERVDKERLNKSFGDSLPPFSDDLFDQSVIQEIESRHPTNPDTSSDEDPIETLQDELQSLIEQRAEKKSASDAAEKLQQEADDLLAVLRRDATEDQRRRWLQRSGPALAFCPVPITEAKESGCTLCHEQLKSFEQAALEKTLQEQVVAQSIVASASATEAKRCEQAMKPFNNAVKNTRERLRRARRTENEKIRTQAATEAAVASLREQASLAKNSWTAADNVREKIKKLRSEIKAANNQIAEWRKQSNRKLRHLNQNFDECVSACLGSEVRGKVELAGKSLVLKIIYRGEMRGSAMKLVRNLALDIAAMKASLDDKAHHPRLLIHDSPRDSDLTADLYHRIFLMAKEMEGAHGPDHAPFQYIITTTEAPPKSMQQSPWLLDPVLDATNPDLRLLRVDL